MKRALFVCLAALAASCGPSDRATESSAVGRTTQAIAGGTTGSDHPGVVGIRIEYDGYNGLCTGSLIAPNLVLTARHCIAPTKPGDVVCGEPAFQAPYPPSASRVTTSGSALSSSAPVVGVEEVWVPDGNDGCGMDIALLLLDGSGIAPSVATPLVPRIDREVAASEKYTAVGYGSTAPGGVNGAGTRRTRAGLSVACIGDACKSINVAANEWRGETGTCIGDSGGPALDADANVIGVLSRSTPTCDDPEYASIVAWKQWLVEHARTAADRAGVAPPAWAAPASAAVDAGAGETDVTPTEPAPPAAPGESKTESSCAIAVGHDTSSVGAYLLALALLLGCARAFSGDTRQRPRHARRRALR